MATTEAAIAVQNLRKTYGDTPAVDGVDLEVPRGEIFALLGPNGAGKTTTVEILEGFRRRDAGTVSVLGVDPGRPTPAWRSRIGIVLQTTGGHDELTVSLDGEPGGLDDKRRTRARHLSGGQRRRLDVALGILGRPDLLFLDEPTTGFDPEARREFWDLIDSLADGGTTIILTTHYLDEAEHLADRVAVINDGRIVAVDTPQRLGGRADREAAVGWTENDERRSTVTAEPTRIVQELAARFPGEIPGLSITRPTLEDVYLQLIGAAGTSEGAPQS